MDAIMNITHQAYGISLTIMLVLQTQILVGMNTYGNMPVDFLRGDRSFNGDYILFDHSNNAIQIINDTINIINDKLTNKLVLEQNEVECFIELSQLIKDFFAANKDFKNLHNLFYAFINNYQTILHRIIVCYPAIAENNIETIRQWNSFIHENATIINPEILIKQSRKYALLIKECIQNNNFSALSNIHMLDIISLYRTTQRLCDHSRKQSPHLNNNLETLVLMQQVILALIELIRPLTANDWGNHDGSPRSKNKQKAIIELKNKLGSINHIDMRYLQLLHDEFMRLALPKEITDRALKIVHEALNAK